MTQSHPLKWIEINRQAIIHNYHYLSTLDPTKQIAPILKSYAYGHRLVEIATILEPLHPPLICLNSFEEASSLHQAGINLPILIIGFVDPSHLAQQPWPFSYVIWSLEQLQAINHFQPHAAIHIFVEAGLNREGIPLAELKSFLHQLSQFPTLKIEGLLSHLACADQPTHPLTIHQISQFNQALAILHQHSIYPKWQHLAASSALLSTISNQSNLPGNLARTGLAFYGYDPSSLNPHLRPALSLKSQLIQIKPINSNQTIGYDATYKTNQPIIVGVLPLGYADGLDRRLSNNGYASINDIPCPFLGRISMNLSLINLSSIPNPQLNQEVTLFNSNPKATNSIQAIAQTCHTIPYQLLANLSPQIPKRIV